MTPEKPSPRKPLVEELMNDHLGKVSLTGAPLKLGRYDFLTAHVPVFGPNGQPTNLAEVLSQLDKDAWDFIGAGPILNIQPQASQKLLMPGPPAAPVPHVILLFRRPSAPPKPEDTLGSERVT